MAYLCKQEFGKSNKAGAGMRFDSKVYALSNGDFVFHNLPDDIQALLKQAGHKLEYRNGKTGLYVKRKDEGVLAINEAMIAQLKVEKSDRLVILYNYTASCHYWKLLDGTLCPNGVDHNEDGEWNIMVVDGEEKMSNYHSSDDYVVGFKAEVRKIVTYTSGAKKREERECPKEDELGEWGNKLNSFAQVRPGSEATVIPYTEESAKVFYQSMLRLCQLSDQLSEFLSEPENIISGTGQLLLGEAKNATTRN